MNKQTHTQTHTQAHIWTFRLIESIGPEGQYFENIWVMNAYLWRIFSSSHKTVFGPTILSRNLTYTTFFSFSFKGVTFSETYSVTSKMTKTRYTFLVNFFIAHLNTLFMIFNLNYTSAKRFALDSLPNKTWNSVQALVNYFTFSMSSFKPLPKCCRMHHKLTAQFFSRVFTTFQFTQRQNIQIPWLWYIKSFNSLTWHAQNYAQNYPLQIMRHRLVVTVTAEETY